MGRVDRRRRLANGICAAVTLLLGSIEAAEAADPAVVIAISGPEEVVYSWQKDRCDDRFIPDAPARAFRDADGLVHLIAPHYPNWELVGTSLDRVRRRCHVLFEGSEDADSGRYDDRAWIEGTYTLDGKTIFALLSNEWDGTRHPGSGCSGTVGRTRRCIYNSLTLAISTDGGETYTPPRGRRLVASLPYRFASEADDDRPAGYGTSSNIIAREGVFYALIGAWPRGAQAYGNCLIRTDSLADAASWRAWDGHDFSRRFVDPYHETDFSPDQHVCEPVGAGSLNWEVRSVSWHAPSQSYITILYGASQSASDRRITGIHYATSPDLISWSAIKMLLAAPSALDRQRCQSFIRYPSLLDAKSASRNFETVGGQAHIYFTRTNVPDCRQTMDRDLVRLPVTITPALSETPR
ncbi:MAG: hypothetical protein U1E42_01370 [Rhodospirillales bacterium]